MKKVFISMACVLIALSGCTNGGSNKESMEVVLNIKRKVKRLKGIILEMQGKHVARTGMYRLRHVPVPHR
jgi:citrate synthase